MNHPIGPWDKLLQLSIAPTSSGIRRSLVWPARLLANLPLRMCPEERPEVGPWIFSRRKRGYITRSKGWCCCSIL